MEKFKHHRAFYFVCLLISLLATELRGESPQVLIRPLELEREEPRAAADSRFFQELSGVVLSEQKTKEKVDLDFFLPEPVGINKGPVHPNCSSEVLKRHMLTVQKNPKQQARVVQNFYQTCQSSLIRNQTRGIASLLEFSVVDYKLFDNPQIKKIDFLFSPGHRLSGFIGIKDTRTPRPWVIVKCGVFCSASPGSSIKNYMIHFFDQSPFNVIFLGNRTGSDYIQNNQKISIGGFLEAHDFFMVADWLTSPVSPYRKTVSSLHAAGISLGGSAAVFASFLEKKYHKLFGRSYFKSVLAICPVINLKDTLDDMYANNLKGQIFSKYTWSEISKSKNSLPEAAPWLQGPKHYKPWEFPSLLADLTTLYFDKELSQHKVLQFFPGLNTREDLWSLSQFSALAEPIETPLLVWASKDDIVVNNNLNTSQLVYSDLFSQSENMGIVNLDYGNHCAFNTAYGFDVAGVTLKNFILTHSPEFSKRWVEGEYALPQLRLFPLRAYETITRVWWKVGGSRDLDELELRMEVFSIKSRGESCGRSTPWSSAKECRRILKKVFALSELSELFRKMGLRVPRTQTEAQALSRYLNANTSFLNKRNQMVVGGFHYPAKVQYQTIDDVAVLD